MNSLGNSSKWPSYDSIPSNSSFLLSESEHTEDEADVFSEAEVEHGVQKSILGDEEITLSGNCLDFPPHSDRLQSRPVHDQSEHCPNKTKCPDSAFIPEASTLTSSSATPGDLAFAQKCADLHRFVHPLLELLHGLKSGRFERGLTSFQQSVAIDRLQRILGILQKPEMGEKYLQNLLQIEMLLKMWFPQLTLSKSTDTTNQTTTPKLAPHWRQNQLHIPVKKRKLSWSDSDHTDKHNHHQHRKHGSCHVATSLNAVSVDLPGPPKRQKTPEEETFEASGQTFTQWTGTSSRQSHFCSKTKSESRNRKQLEISPPSLCGSPATQDSLVSSSNAVTTTDSP